MNLFQLKNKTPLVQLIFLALLFWLPGIAFSDQPLPPPATHKIYSQNPKIFAISDVSKNLTTVYSKNKKGGSKLWEIPGWYRVVYLSSDGECLVVGYDGMNLIPQNYEKSEVMLRFFCQGKLIRSVALGELIKDWSKLQRTVSHFHWMRHQGIDQNGNFMLETIERKFWFDVKTGKEK